MENSSKFMGIVVMNDAGVERTFDFEIGRQSAFGQSARIISDNYELLIDDDIRGDLPMVWRGPAIAVLLQLVNNNRNEEDIFT